MITKAEVILGGNKLEVILNTRDSKLALNLNKLAKKISARTKTESTLALSKEKIQVIGGAMLKTSDSKIIMDNTFEDILKQREKSLKAKISKILFN
ncbi:V-type ATP synthase subunit E family protein [Candidatus Bathyarchaeota archaeon]|nr:V-type ATP synthase subunit E family protein [Candidatus Bathyarchaeota archaeon]